MRLNYWIIAVLLGALAGCGKEERKQDVHPAPAASAPEPAVMPPAPAPEPAPPASTSASTYTVEHGDTLFKIAKDHDLKYADLASWNEIKDPKRLRVGQELRLTAP